MTATVPVPVRSFVAIGDSFTEGLADDRGDGVYRGWADLVAARLAQDEPALGYANLAVRGKLMGQIRADQLDAAAGMRTDLACVAGGLNDVMRPGCDIDAVCADLLACAEELARTSGRVLMFRVIDFRNRMRSARRIWPKIERLSAVVDQMVEKHGVIAVDLTSARVFDDPRLWAVDRIHLTDEGHRRVAAAVLEAMGYEVGFDWRAPLAPEPPAGPLRRAARRARSDVQWFVTFLAPWIKRRLTGKSSGDGVPPKRPELAPVA